MAVVEDAVPHSCAGTHAGLTNLHTTKREKREKETTTAVRAGLGLIVLI